MYSRWQWQCKYNRLFIGSFHFLFPVSMYFALIRQWSSISCMSSTQISLNQNCPTCVLFFVLFFVIFHFSVEVVRFNCLKLDILILDMYIIYSIYTFILYKNLESEELTAPFYCHGKTSLASVKKKKDFLFREWNVPLFLMTQSHSKRGLLYNLCWWAPQTIISPPSPPK